MHMFPVAVLLIAILSGCAQNRPAPEVAADFQTRRPMMVAVLPVVYYPKDKIKKWQDPPEINGRFYQRLLFEEKDHEKNRVYLGLEKSAREILQKRGISVVDPLSLAEVMRDMRFNGRLDWDELARKLKVDSLLFITLEDWNLSRFKEEHRVRVRLELALFNIQSQNLLWRDHNGQGSFSLQGKDLKVPIAALTQKAAESTFASFPIK